MIIVSNSGPIISFASLGLGEREAIVLVEELKAFLLIDDRLARKEAEKRGIMCFGSLRVLKCG